MKSQKKYTIWYKPKLCYAKVDCKVNNKKDAIKKVKELRKLSYIDIAWYEITDTYEFI